MSAGGPGSGTPRPALLVAGTAAIGVTALALIDLSRSVFVTGDVVRRALEEHFGTRGEAAFTMSSAPEIYERLSEMSLLSSELWGRTPIYPLMIKAIGLGAGMHGVQVLGSVLAWIWLSWEVMKLPRSRGVGLAAFGVLLGTSRATAVQMFNHLATSDSLSVTLGVSMAASALRMFRRPDQATLYALVALSVVWSLVRPTNFLVTGLATVLILIVGRMSPNSRSWSVRLGASLAGVTALAMALMLWGGAGETTMFNIVPRWVMTDAEMSRYFEDRGMPLDRSIETVKGVPLSNEPVLEEPWLLPWTRWVEQEGMSTYVSWMASHPDWVARRYASNIGPMLAPTMGQEQVVISQIQDVNGGSLPAGSEFGDVMWLDSGWLLVAWSIAAVVPLILLGRATEPAGWALFGFALLACAPLLAVPVYFGDSESIERHALGLAVQARVGLVLISAWVADELVRRRGEPSADRVATRSK